MTDAAPFSKGEWVRVMARPELGTMRVLSFHKGMNKVLGEYWVYRLEAFYCDWGLEKVSKAGKLTNGL